ncbi:MAG TPA: hypothetical protein VGM90_27870 [Kofleriaceae bacterium]|jgi:predicted small lipoprotein YifL
MKKMLVIAAVVGMAFAACGKKNPPAAPAGDMGSGSAMGSGSDATAPAGDGAGSGSAEAPAPGM